jgi:hypothetical protein
MKQTNKHSQKQIRQNEQSLSSIIRHKLLKSLTLEAIPSATQFFKRSYKISHNSGLEASLVALPSFAALSKIRPDFIKKVVLKLKFSKNHYNKKCTPKILFFNEKK